MKNIIITIFTLSLIFGCDQKENDAAPEVQKVTTEVAYAKLASVKTSAGDLKVELLSVNDSRCPSNVVCVWAGVADVKFSISDSNDKTDVAVTFAGADKDASQAFKLGSQNYLISVTQVLPYPETSKSPELEDYKINVSIEKQK